MNRNYNSSNLLLPGTKGFVDSSEIASDLYHMAIQYVLRSLNCTTYTICILTQTNSMHEACISTITRLEAIEQYPLTSFNIIAGWFRSWVWNEIFELMVRIYPSSFPSMLGIVFRRYVISVMA